MPKFLACYDLNDKNSPHYNFIEAGKELGWEPWVLSSKDEWNRLPNTTIIGTFANLDEAIAAFKAIKPKAESALGASITVEKWFLAEYTNVRFTSDEKIPASG